MTTRRQFLTYSLSAITSVSLSSCFQWQEQSWFVSCCTAKNGDNFAAAFDRSGRLISTVAIPSRGHQVVTISHKPGHAYVIARRPETFLIEVDFKYGRIVNHTNTQHGQHFYGHGVVSQDGTKLYTSENDFKNQRGLVTVRDTSNLAVINSYSSGGLGPHQLQLMPNQSHLVVANGGILTHPDTPRKKLNLDSMQPNLTYLSIDTGHILSQHHITNNQLSIRHLDVANSGEVIIGLQSEGPKNAVHPLVLSHRYGQQLTPFFANNSVWRQMKGYTASVAIDNNQQVAAVTCPRANLVTYWDIKTHEFVSSQRISDGAGVYSFGNEFVVTSGKGHISSVSTAKQHNLANHMPLKWDNHLSKIQST